MACREITNGDRGGYWVGEDLGKENIWCENTQLQNPSTVNTCVMLNRMDKRERGWNNGILLHSEHVSETAWGYGGLCVCVHVCVSINVNVWSQRYHPALIEVCESITQQALTMYKLPFCSLTPYDS